MGDIHFLCGSCGKHMAIDEQGGGRAFKCPDCAVSVIVPAFGIKWNCSNCGVQIRAQAGLAGEIITCLACESRETVPLKKERIAAPVRLHRPGEWDMGAMLKEATEVREASLKIARMNSRLKAAAWIWGALFGGLAAVFGCAGYELDENGAPVLIWWLKLLACLVGGGAGVAGLLSRIRQDPWPPFVADQSAFFVRLFLYPPPPLREAMYEDFHPLIVEASRGPLRYALDNNFGNIIESEEPANPGEDHGTKWLFQFTLRAAEVFVRS